MHQKSIIILFGTRIIREGNFHGFFWLFFPDFLSGRCIKKVIIILFGTRNIREAENVFKIFNFILWIFPDFSTEFPFPDLVLIFLRIIFCENVVDFPGFFPRISVSGFIVLLDPCLCSSNGGHNVTPDHSSIYIQLYFPPVVVYGVSQFLLPEIHLLPHVE